MWRPTTRQARSVPFKFVSTILFTQHRKLPALPCVWRCRRSSQYLHATQRRTSSIKNSLRGFIGDITGDFNRAASQRLNLLCRGTRQFCAPTGGDNIRAGGGKAFCERQANPAGPPITTAILLVRSSCGWPKKFSSRHETDKRQILPQTIAGNADYRPK
jgi:hypothetical protein